MPNDAPSRFDIILSTYNGMRYLEEQLRSIESQVTDNIEIRLIIRDDGSTDGTVDFLKEYSSQRNWVSLDLGSNIGVVESFLSLLESLSDCGDFVAFCDQDDVWDDDKLKRAKDALEEFPEDVPAIYFSGVRLVDETRRLIGVTSPCKREVGFRNALVQNVATGCTVVINRCAAALFSGRDIDKSKVIMHDRWIYLVVSALGNVVCDNSQTMDYRQHGKNVVGSKKGWDLWINRIKRVRARGQNQLVDQAKELLRVYGGELHIDKKRIGTEFIEEAGSESILVRSKYAWGAPVYRQSTLDDFLMRVMICLGRR